MSEPIYVLKLSIRSRAIAILIPPLLPFLWLQSQRVIEMNSDAVRSFENKKTDAVDDDDDDDDYDDDDNGNDNATYVVVFGQVED